MKTIGVFLSIVLFSTMSLAAEKESVVDKATTATKKAANKTVAAAKGLVDKTPAENAVRYVPNGKLVKVEKDEVKIQTPKGGVVEVELNLRGELAEASGNMADSDDLIPGKGLLSLRDAVSAAKKAGKAPKGEWSLEYGMINGWYYEFQEYKNGSEFEYLVSAKDGNLLKEKKDN